MANIHLEGSGGGGNITFGKTTMPKYVGAKAEVTRVEGGIRIWLKDYRGETEEIIAEAISDIVTNQDGSLTFVLPDGQEITTGSLAGPAGADGTDGADGFSPIAAVERVGNTAKITITDKNGTTTASVSDGSPGSGGCGIPYGRCLTYSDVQAKVVDIPGVTEIVEGTIIAVNFNWRNSALEPTLNVNNLGAEPIKLGNPGPYAKYAAKKITTATQAAMIDDVCLLEYTRGVGWRLQWKESQSDWNDTDTASPGYIANKPGAATSSEAGLMSAADKTKLNSIPSNLISKDDIIVLSGTVTGVANNGGTGLAQWTAADLGIDSLDDIVVLSVDQDMVGNVGREHWFGSPYGGAHSGMITYDLNYPFVSIDHGSTPKLILHVFNWSETQSGTADIAYRLVLLKL